MQTIADPGGIRAAAGELKRFAAGAARAMGADAETAACVAAHLAAANLAGHDSHGVMRLAQYAAQVASGELKPAARPCILRERGAICVVDAGRSFGQLSTMFAMEWAIGRARETGVAAAAIRHSAHIGRLGHYAERACAAGMAAVITAGAAGHGVGGMIPFGGRARFLAANPWAVGIPGRVVFDASTSTIAEGKVRVARARGEMLPAECIVDAEGRASREPEDFYAGGALVPLGGAAAGHKGYGFALTAALLGGLAMIGDAEPSTIGVSVKQDGGERAGAMAGVLVLALDPEFFGGAEEYEALTRGLIEAARRVPSAEGTRVMIPGEVEERTRERRMREGIPLPAATMKELEHLAERFGIAPPAPMAGQAGSRGESAAGRRV